jgi:hypothetical protein
MADSIRGTLPPIYQPLFGEFFDRPKVVETRATCEKCAMCDHGQASPVEMDFFNPDTKCCTFMPILPNYLVGSILADDTPEMAEGKKRIRAVISKLIGVTPHHLSRPRKMTLVMSGYGEAFGRAKSLLCPYYDGSNPAGACTIWRHREVICLTYHCKYAGGKRGYDYWGALKTYLGFVQRSLARSATQAVDPKVVEPVFKKNLLTVEDIDDLPPKEADYKKWWGSWVGREEEFYLKCWEWVTKISPAAFAKNIDEVPDGKTALADLVAKYDLLENKVLPSTLVRNGRMKESHVGEKVVVTSYHPYDSFALDKELYEVVGMFKADQTLSQNLDRLKRDEGVELAPELIEYLFMAGVLIEPTKQKVADVKAENAGELNGRRAALGAVLMARGLTPNDASLRIIKDGDIAKLDLWIKKAVVAKTVEEILSE